MTNELVINGQTYEFKFGMGFLREIDKRQTRTTDGFEQNVGLLYYIALLTENNLEALFEVLYLANKGFKPRLEQAVFDEWIEDEDTDVEEVFKAVLNFLSTSNPTKTMTKRVMEQIQ